MNIQNKLSNLKTFLKKIYDDKDLLASYCLQIVLVATFIIALIQQEWIWVLGCLVAVSIGFIPTILKKNIEVTLPWPIGLLFALVCGLNMAGVLLDAYHIIPWYGEITQFFTSVLVAFIAFAIIYILHVYWDGLIMDKYAMAFVVVIGTMASCVILEFVKWFRLFGAKQTSVEGVLISLLTGTIGGIIMALIGVSLINTGELDELTGNLGKQFDTTLKKHQKNKKEGSSR